MTAGMLQSMGDKREYTSESVSRNDEFISRYDSCLEKVVALPEEKKAEALAIAFEEGKKNGIKTFIVFDSPAGGFTQVKGTVLEQKVKEYFL